MDISVIVPIYGVEIYIERCLRSLFNQTKSVGVEYILVNDCTPDRSMEIAREVVAEFPHLDIKIIEHAENQKVAATRQTGLDLAQGEYTIQIDSDDWCEPTMLADMFALAKAEDADIVVADFYDRDGVLVHQKEEYDPVKCVATLMRFENRDLSGFIWNKLVRRSLYVDNSILCDNGVNQGEDHIFMIMLFSYAQRIAYLSTPYLHYTNNPISMTKSKQSRVYVEDRVMMCYIIVDFLKERGFYLLHESECRVMTLKSKEGLVKIARGESQRYAIDSFPEVDDYILSERSFTWGSRIALYLATHGCRRVANVIYDIVGLYKPQITR